ncbi:hypothetical protein [Phaeovulum sp.]|uniref:hypothetical protein n=1 Tax=Phaeovulum sp. TaxID=2934796 RepID=UPI0039E2E420
MRPKLKHAGFAVLALMLAACQPDPSTPKLEPVGAARVALARSACEKGGGAFRQLGGAGAFICQRTPKDAGKSCTSDADCEGACLARSMTCAPVIPLPGCNDVLTNSGMRVTECVE